MLDCQTLISYQIFWLYGIYFVGKGSQSCPKGLSTAEGGREHVTMWTIKIQAMSIFSNNCKLDSGCRLHPTFQGQGCAYAHASGMVRYMVYTSSLAQPKAQ